MNRKVNIFFNENITAKLPLITRIASKDQIYYHKHALSIEPSRAIWLNPGWIYK